MENIIIIGYAGGFPCAFPCERWSSIEVASVIVSGIGCQSSPAHTEEYINHREPLYFPTPQEAMDHVMTHYLKWKTEEERPRFNHEKLRQIVRDLVNSENKHEHYLGMELQARLDADGDMLNTVEVLRDASNGIQEALHTLEKRWNEAVE